MKKRINSAALILLLMLMWLTSVSASAQAEAADRVTAIRISAEDIKAGDRIIIYCEQGSCALSNLSSAKTVSPIAVSVKEQDGTKVIVNAPVQAAAFTVSYSESGKMLLQNDGGRLAVPQGGGLTITPSAEAFSEWEVVDGCFLYNVNYAYTNGSNTYRNYYLEYYDKGGYFTTYGKSKNADPAPFTMSFFLVTDDEWGKTDSEDTYYLPLFETSDTHGYLADTSVDPDLYHLARIGHITQAARSLSGSYDKSRTLLLDTGDIYQGNTLSNLLSGNPIRAAYDAMDYDAVSIGNHEFDWGLSVSVDQDSTMADYTLNGEAHSNTIPVVLSNLYQNGDKADWLNDYVILNKNATKANGETLPVRIAVIGFAENYASSIMTSAFTGLGYEIREDYAAMEALAKNLEESDQCDACVLLCHAEAREVASKLSADSRIDLVLGGHTHFNACGINDSGVTYLQPAAYGSAYAYAELGFQPDDGGKAVFDDVSAVKTVSMKDDLSLLYNTSENAGNLDQRIVAVTEDAIQQLKPMLESTIGYITTGVLDSKYFADDTQRNCTAGNWLCSITARSVGADIGFFNGGGIRVEFPIPEGKDKYDVTVSDIYAMLPFNNAIYLYELTGEELLQVFEYSMSSAGNGLFTYVSGIDCYFEGSTVHALVLNGELLYQDGEWFGGWQDKTLRLAVTEYIATSNRTSEGVSNPLVGWNDTERLLDHNAIDVESALVLLKEESAANNGYLYVDDSPHFINGNYQPLLGDVDGDGGVTILDATIIQRRLANITVSTFIDAAADTDEDGELTILDATMIQRWLVGLSCNDHIGKPQA